MTPAEFAQKWRDSTRTERSASQEHFLDLCRVVGHATPGDMDPSGEFFTFEKGAAILGGGQGWADVWKRGHFAWEYKGPKANLDAALRQVKGVPRRSGESAAADRLRPQELRDPHQLYQHRHPNLRL